jgi:hypothetical protein
VKRAVGWSVADIFHEVDEEVRREQLKKLWERYGHYAVALAILIVLGVAGWRGYQYWQSQKAAEAGAAFERALTLSEQDKHEEAAAAFGKIAAEGTWGYRTLARMREAAELAQRDPQAAVKIYDEIAADRGVGQVLQDLAALRAGLLLVDGAPYEELRRRIEPLTTRDRTFRHSARELLALSAWRAGDLAAAQRWFDMITTDAETPASTRGRIEVLMALVAAQSKGG